MGAVCGKGHSLQEDDAPYETKDSVASRSLEKSARKKKASVQSAEIAQNGDENLVEEVEDEIQQKEAEEVKSEIKPSGMLTSCQKSKLRNVYSSRQK